MRSAVKKTTTKPAVKPPIPKKLLAPVTKALTGSFLPGEKPLTSKEAKSAAEFIVQAGLRRDQRRSAIALETVTDERRFMRIAIINDDMPFLVDSAAAAIAAAGLAIDRLVHPVLGALRDASGQLRDLSEGGKGKAQLESIIYIETSRVDARRRRSLLKAIRTAMGDVRAAVSDWPKLQRAMASDAKTLASARKNSGSAALLGWLNDGMLTQLGHVTRMRDGTVHKPLGICRKSTPALLAEASFERAFDWFDRQHSADALLIIKANHIALVHRRVPLDIFICAVREGKKVVGLSVHAGVWTSAALAAPPRDVPLLSQRLSQIMEAHDFDAAGHAGKALVHALTTLPHDLVVGFSPDDTERLATTMMGLVDRPRPRLALVKTPLARHIFVFVWLPRDMVATQVRLQIQTLLEEGVTGEMLDWSLEVEGGNLAMLRFVFDIRGNDPARDISSEAALDQRLQTMLRGWSEAVETELAQIIEPGRAAALAMRWANAFPPEYRGASGAHEAARDIAVLNGLGQHAESEGAPQRACRLYRNIRSEEGALRLKLYTAEGTLPLSDAVPTLENFGFRVEAEMPTMLNNGELGTIHDFALEFEHGQKAHNADPDALISHAPFIEEAIAATLNGEAENDPFNRLVPETGLTAEEAGWMRAFYRYLRQTGLSYTIYTVVDALRGAPGATKALIALLRALHDPGYPAKTQAKRTSAIAAAEADFTRALAQVSAINDDRVLRLYQSLIHAILRTNAFASSGADAKTGALAFKINSAFVPGLPKPVPWREIFVYSRRLEGIHLRTGPVARGGLRWSDRRDDFRTEILGLMKAQRVKNAVIVPSGAKGGFYPKQLPDPAMDRDAWAAEGQASYEVFITALLSVTDNIAGDKVIHPQGVLCHDGEDPYFVVAADKGTARFSDVANRIAQSQDFWLDDAFASGGSNGYDHKAMGITARGAWVSVQRHFLEMGIDVQQDPVSVAGCGDMSGDVFGNGMLLSKAIRLVAAFDHRHIFIDPSPDPARSWKERKRLFELPRSSWENYNPKLISTGGGVFSRSDKQITLSKAAQDALGIEVSQIEPEALITAILKAPVDLLWFGGIGTYIKAAHESGSEVGDPGNDAVRIDASELRAKAIGEGANLGTTQAGRIEFAMRGGRINTDFIDNSAGVDCSDNEVNIKIALAAARRSGKLSERRRNALLEEMTDEVAAAVLDNNRLQALALSIAQIGGAGAVPSYLHLMRGLEERGQLDRETEGLAEDQVFLRRASEGAGLTRPELAVLISSAKLVLQDAIEGSDLPDDPALHGFLKDSFPQPMRGRFKAQIEGHRLRREIIATKLANALVNRLGVIHAFELAEEEGAQLAQVAAAFVTVSHLFGLEELWTDLEAAPMPEKARLVMFDRLAAASGNLMSDLLRTCGGQVTPAAMIERLGKSVKLLSRSTGQLLSDGARQQSAALQDSLIAADAPQLLAAKVTNLFDLDGSVALAHLAAETGLDPKALARAFIAIGARLGLDWAQSTAAMMNPSDVWERLLVDGLARDFQQMRLELVRRLSKAEAKRQAARKKGKTDIGETAKIWAQKNDGAIRQFRSMVERAQTEAQVTPAMLAQIASAARTVLNR